MDSKPLYIFDLDGTLSLAGHRIHLLGSNDPDRRMAFSAACIHDLPNKPVIDVMQSLSTSADIWIFTGRSDVVRAQTVTWLLEHTGMSFAEETLVMRSEGDHTPDHSLKQCWLESMLHDDRDRLIAVFEDRDRVVAMWRTNGIACMQVARGEF